MSDDADHAAKQEDAARRLLELAARRRAQMANVRTTHAGWTTGCAVSERKA